MFHWSLYKAEDEEWYDEQHGAKGVADCCTIVPVDYRGEYPNDDVITNKMSCNEENIQQSYIILVGLMFFCEPIPQKTSNIIQM